MALTISKLRAESQVLQLRGHSQVTQAHLTSPWYEIIQEFYAALYTRLTNFL
jgi:hypothetical protein